MECILGIKETEKNTRIIDNQPTPKLDFGNNPDMGNSRKKIMS